MLLPKLGDSFAASEELDNALLFDHNSAIVHYQYAQMLLQKFDDAQAALDHIDSALAKDPCEEALETLKALCLNRLGRCSEAAAIYERQLVGLAIRPRKWRITTRDQAAECYRRWAEHDLKMKETKCFKEHIARAASILEEGIADNDFDPRMGALLVTIIEDALFFAVASLDEAYAKQNLQKLMDAHQATKLPKFKRFLRDHLPTSPNANPDWNLIFDHPTFNALFGASQENAVDSIDAASSSDSRTGKIIRLPDKKTFGFIAEVEGDLFFHKSALVNSDDWQKLRVGMWLKYERVTDERGKCLARCLSPL